MAQTEVQSMSRIVLRYLYVQMFCCRPLMRQLNRAPFRQTKKQKRLLEMGSPEGCTGNRGDYCEQNSSRLHDPELCDMGFTHIHGRSQCCSEPGFRLKSSIVVSVGEFRQTRLNREGSVTATSQRRATRGNRRFRASARWI
jgi:hypothetical protein